MLKKYRKNDFVEKLMYDNYKLTDLCKNELSIALLLFKPVNKLDI